MPKKKPLNDAEQLLVDIIRDDPDAPFSVIVARFNAQVHSQPELLRDVIDDLFEVYLKQAKAKKIEE
jgi:hypothetical protein